MEIGISRIYNLKYLRIYVVVSALRQTDEILLLLHLIYNLHLTRPVPTYLYGPHYQSS